VLPYASCIGESTVKVEYGCSKLAIALKSHHGNHTIKQRFSAISILHV
jgi:hypothetical protein